MALIKCNECGGQVSDRASFCPSCGNPDFRTEIRNERFETRSERTMQGASPPLPDAPSEVPAAGTFADLQFRQTRSQRNKSRSVWPKLIMVSLLLASGYGLYKTSPMILARVAGKPSHGQLEQLLAKPLAGSLSVNGYKVPGRFVDILEFGVRNIETFDRRGDVVLYRVSGDAVARLTVSGDEIGKDVEGQIGSNAQRLDFRSAREAVYSRFRAHAAMANVPAGTRYRLHYDVIVRMVDGNAVLVDGSVSSDN